MKYILLRLKKMEIKKVFGLYVKTKKNIQTENFYDNLNFKVSSSSNELKNYYLDLNEFKNNLSPKIYKIL